MAKFVAIYYGPPGASWSLEAKSAMGLKKAVAAQVRRMWPEENDGAFTIKKRAREDALDWLAALDIQTPKNLGIMWHASTQLADFTLRVTAVRTKHAH